MFQKYWNDRDVLVLLKKNAKWMKTHQMKKQCQMRLKLR